MPRPVKKSKSPIQALQEDAVQVTENDIKVTSGEIKYLIVGLVSPIGADKELVKVLLRDSLVSYACKVKPIKITNIVSSCPRYCDAIKQTNVGEDRIRLLINTCDNLRAEGGNDYLAKLALFSINREVTKSSNHGQRNVFIIDSLKHPSEVRFLKSIFGPHFLTISCYEDRNQRITNLASKIAKECAKISLDHQKPAAMKLIEDDEKEDLDHGQNIRDTFPLADVFIKIGDRDSTKSQIDRVIRIWFNYPVSTPTVAEYAMFIANAASLRSAELGRQVGAAVVSQEGEVIATGFNEVPKPLGGVYIHGDNPDYRDFKLGEDSNQKYKNIALNEITLKFKNSILTTAEQHKRVECEKCESIETAIEELVQRPSDTIYKGTRANSLIEFGRCIHAEMAVIAESARRGIALKTATLYCTTYPCHLCARQILAAGIIKVVYLEPYAKSMVEIMYDKIITSEDTSCGNRVPFIPFVGIAPRRYVEFFEQPEDRKKINGQVRDWNETTAFPKIPSSLTYLVIGDIIYQQVNDFDLSLLQHQPMAVDESPVTQ